MGDDRQDRYPAGHHRGTEAVQHLSSERVARPNQSEDLRGQIDPRAEFMALSPLTRGDLGIGANRLTESGLALVEGT